MEARFCMSEGILPSREEWSKASRRLGRRRFGTSPVVLQSMLVVSEMLFGCDCSKFLKQVLCARKNGHTQHGWPVWKACSVVLAGDLVLFLYAGLRMEHSRHRTALIYHYQRQWPMAFESKLSAYFNLLLVLVCQGWFTYKFRFPHERFTSFFCVESGWSGLLASLALSCSIVFWGGFLFSCFRGCLLVLFWVCRCFLDFLVQWFWFGALFLGLSSFVWLVWAPLLSLFTFASPCWLRPPELWHERLG